MVIIDQVTNETAARAYSQKGHGKILKPIQRPDTYQRLPEDVQLNTCERQPVHTFGLKAAISCKLSEGLLLVSGAADICMASKLARERR
jgi:hypothetical protein